MEGGGGVDGAGRLPGRRLVSVDRGVVECGGESGTGRGGGQRGGSVGQVEEGGGLPLASVKIWGMKMKTPDNV